VSLPIRLRVTLWYVILLALLIASLGVFVVVRLRADLLAGVDETLATRAAQIALSYNGTSDGEFQDVSDASLQGLPGSESAAQLLDAQGNVLETSGDPAGQTAMVGSAELGAALRGSSVHGSISVGRDGEPFRILAVSLPGATPRVVVVATSLDTVDRSVHRLWVLLLLAGPAVLAVAGVGGWWIARAALAPVAVMAKKAGEIGIERLDERLDVPARADEIHDLAVTMNAMLGRLERGVHDQRRFVADASHELRTPLAIMRAELEVSMRDRDLAQPAREALSSVLQEVERMGATVEDMLTLAKADEGRLTLELDRIDLAEVARAARDALGTMAAGAGVQVHLDGRATASADRRRVEQVLRNLLANAIRYVGRGGHVVVEVGGDGRVATCAVRDDGPGIPPDALAHVFDRFYRADASRAGAGSGLGLAICREIVAAHGGTIDASSEPGHGSVFTFTLPGAGPAGRDRGRPRRDAPDRITPAR
jgi:two-component system OmpR family sensor kinase